MPYATMRDNIDYDNLMPSVSRQVSTTVRRSKLDSVVEAAKKAQLHETIEELPKQYETLIKTSDYSPFGGWKHRLSLARAILRGDVKLDHYLNRKCMDGMSWTGAIDEVMKILKEKCDASSHSKCGGHALCRSHAYALGVPISS